MNKNKDYRILIADDEQIECIALELLLKNTFADIQILPSASNGVASRPAISWAPPT